MKIKRSDKYTILVLSFFTLIYIVGTIDLGAPFNQGAEPSLSVFPWIIICAMIIGIIGYYIGSIKEYSGEEEGEKSVFLSIAKPLSGCLIIGLFILLFFFLGYWIASVFLCFFTAIMFEYESSNMRKTVIIAALVSVLIPIIGYFFYQKLFHIRLPEGIIW
jgi:hypothetical protein